ncbi:MULTISPECIES: hypothetical protein [unclassified Iodidimonas]|uniref:hypothetical protein n=1 Tax=unclassified Iodidimonas TaxID=2626145 RepID=UPI0024821F83|nr:MULTISPECIES: hypothetical protein [unclassified Iodidimonas]
MDESETYKKIPESIAEENDSSDTVPEHDTGALEAETLSQGLDEKEIKRRAAENEHHRNEKFRDHFEYVAILVLWVFTIIIIGMVLTWAYHTLFSCRWHWLSTSQLEVIKSLSIGGIIASLGVGHIKKRLGP